ncbi:MAG: ferritin [Thermoguttaceae bacterium]|jgi:ferritin
MLSQKVQDAFNKQINAELHSSYLYLSMAAYFEAKDLKGMAHWMTIQANEEKGHGMRLFDFINDRSGRVTLTQIEAPKTEWKSPLEAFEDAYKHEVKITGMINELFTLVAIEKDGAGHDFLEWFCREQVEEEANAQLIVAQLKLVGDNGVGLYLLDQELGKRSAE